MIANLLFEVPQGGDRSAMMTSSKAAHFAAFCCFSVIQVYGQQHLDL